MVRLYTRLYPLVAVIDHVMLMMIVLCAFVGSENCVRLRVARTRDVDDSNAIADCFCAGPLHAFERAPQ